jgi:Beta-lactamase
MASRVESQLAALTAASTAPGLQYVVVTAGGVLFEHASGWADIRRQVPLEGTTTMMAYSMSKTITAVAVLQQVESGRVGLDEPAERYLGSMLPYGPRVTVRQLISHTSGIPNPIPLRWVHAADLCESFDEDAALAAVLKKHPRLSFAPGSRYAYSNIGYWLLGKVVERATGETFTAKGFGRFLQDQLREHSRLLSADTRQQFYTQQCTARGIPVPMTLGWHIRDVDGRRFFYKDGGGGGFRCTMRLYPGSGVGTVAMTNATGFDVARLLNRIDPAFLRERGPAGERGAASAGQRSGHRES